MLSRDTFNKEVAPARLCAFLMRQLSRIAQERPEALRMSETVITAKLQARVEAVRMGALFVKDIHLLFALLRGSGVSVEKVLEQCGTSPGECLAYLDELFPAAATATEYDFPRGVNEAARRA